MRMLLRTTTALVAGALVVSTATMAHAAPDDRSGRWLAGQLTDGLIHNDNYGGFDDYGLTADTAFALAAIGGNRSAVRDIRRALAPRVDSWTTGADFDSSDVYAGSTAKAVVLAQTTGADPRAFGGVNLVRRLNSRVSGAEPTVGRIEDRTAGDDYSNVIGQLFAAQGLANAKSAKSGKVVRFLLQQQCSQGYFRLNFAAKEAVDQSCDAGDPAGASSPDTDVTALAVLSLVELPRQSRAVRSAVKDATRWLKRHQKKNGSFGGGTATEASNANSTGLAGWALGEVGACRKAAESARWVKKLQVRGDVKGTPLAGEKGAIAYDRAAQRTAQSDGITSESRDQWRRATAQAAPVLGFLGSDCATSR